ncbi:MAG TPA: PQQ-binding-like beta-propeller repeat protein [Terracidiphilus sp.]|nr:PQQ-binding-like beta-propeller repeat protein [Terracidiphilus sp.]
MKPRDAYAMCGRLPRFLALATVLAWASAGTWSQSAFTDNDWPTYGGDLGNTRYRPFDQINASNFDQLEVAWRFKTDNLGNHPEYKLEGTPLVVNGVLYATGGTRRDVVALDAATGELLWVHGEHEGERGANAPRGLSGRGLAYWSDGKESRIIYATPGYRLIALDAKTGEYSKGFGDHGVVDLKLNDDQKIDLIHGAIGTQAAPIVTGNEILIGAAFVDGGDIASKTEYKGYVRAFDVRTGKRLWIFHTVPMKGEFGYDTWLNGSAEYTGNTGMWTQMSVDEQLGLAYLPIELPTGDDYGGNRPGNTLFGESLVCVDLKTGKRKWHYQLVHHGLWDMDISAPPILGDIVVNGKTIKAVAQPTKESMLYVFDRVTGEPVWPIVEKPVPQGDVPGEWYSRTQPFPTKPPAYDRNGISVEDLIDFTPKLRADALRFIQSYAIGPVFSPPVLSKVSGPLALLTLGTNNGGTNWAGGSYDPETHLLFVSSCSSCLIPMGIVPAPKDVSDMGYLKGIAGQPVVARIAGTGAGESADALATKDKGMKGIPASPATRGPPRIGLSVDGLPLIKPPYGRFTAIDLDKGEIKWQIPFGPTPDAVRYSPLLKDLKIPPTGESGLSVGSLVTKALVIAGDGAVGTSASGIRGAALHAYDKATGKEIGAIYLPAPQTGSPMTYMLNGKQYIVVAVGGATYSGEYIAFTLPSE